MGIKEVWRVFKGSSMQDWDMQKAFKRAATPNACIELLEESDKLKQLLRDIKKWDVDQYLLLPVDLRSRIQSELDT